MALGRSLLREAVRFRDTATGFHVMLGNATITVREPGTVNAIAQTIYAAETGGTTLSNPLTANANGEIEIWLPLPQFVDLLVQSAGRADVTFSNIPVMPQPDEIVTLEGAQSLLNKTLTNPIVTDGDFTEPMIHDPIMTGAVTLNGAPAVGGQTLFADGLIGSPGVSYIADTNTGLRRVSADYQALTVGGVDAIQVRNGVYGTLVRMGNVFIEDPAADPFGVLLHMHHQTSVANDGTIGIHSEITNNASMGALGAGPDSAAATLVVYQTDANAQGAMRALEAHAVRGHANAGDDSINWTVMGAEIGVHSVAPGNAAFTGFDGQPPKSMGIYLVSDDAAFASGAVRADCGLYIHGGAGFEWPIWVRDTNGSTPLFGIYQDGRLMTNNAGNAAAPQWSFFPDPDTGVFWGGTNVLAFATGGSERMRVDSNGLGIGGSAPSGSRLYVTGGRTEIAELKQAGNWGLGGVTPSAVQAGYAMSNYTTNRGLDMSTATAAIIGWTLATLVDDLKAKGVVG